MSNERGMQRGWVPPLRSKCAGVCHVVHEHMSWREFGLPDANLHLLAGFLPKSLCESLFDLIRTETSWVRKRVEVKGMINLERRLTAYMADDV
eukprot:7404095-Karenia_brevis.AAC.1